MSDFSVELPLSKNEVEWARLMSGYKYVVDTQSKVVHVKRDGRLEGRQEGEKNKAIEVARNLKAIGESVEKVVSVTGLSYEVIKNL